MRGRTCSKALSHHACLIHTFGYVYRLPSTVEEEEEEEENCDIPFSIFYTL
jgi:hypothetical protein